jgi:uncharacterized protein (UPF0332 family)
MKYYKEDYINYRKSKSEEVFMDAVLLADNNRWNSSVNRLYYSSYYLANALLYKNEIKADMHNGVKIQLFLNFVKTDKLSKNLDRLYSLLFDWRQETDYADFIEFDESIVKLLIRDVKELNNKLKELLNS